VKKVKNEPSEKVMIQVLEFFMKTSIPRLLAQKEQKKGA
jgi:hypothetical protein